MSVSMNVRNCRKCGRIFNYVVGPILCPRCVEEQEKVFQVVKEYVIEHHGADIAEVSRECNVEPSQIRQWIREERLQFADDSPIRIPCEGCGAMIRSGRYCDKCKAAMTNGFREAMGVNKQPAAPTRQPSRNISERDRMRYL